MGNPFGRSVILPLTNQSGGSVAAGDVVYLDTAHDDSFTTGTTSAYTGGIGIAQQAIGAGSVGLVLVQGYASLVNVNASVTRGDYGKTYTVAKQATDAGADRVAGAFCQFLKGGTTPDAMVWQPDLGAGSFHGCRLSNSGNISCTGGVDNAMTFDTERYDTDAFHSTVSNTSRVTIPSGMGGKYLFTGDVFASGGATGDYLAVKVNGTTFSAVQAGGGGHLTIATVIDLVATDYVELVYNPAAGRTVSSLSIYSPSFTASLLGA